LIGRTHERVLAGIYLVVLGTVSGSWSASAAAQTQAPAVGISTDVRDASGRTLAAATFRDAPGQVLIHLDLIDKPALLYTHGIQIHEIGRCDPPDFSSAGRIFNPFGKQHGFLNRDGPMAGDIPNLVISPDGLPSYDTAASLVSLAPGPASLVRPGGSSLIIYAQADDQLSQPEGNAGARLACGVIVPAAPGETGGGAVPTAGRQDGYAGPLIGALGVLLFAAGVYLRRARRSPP
jgi:superoxide dismutase, Cu-Zn family